MPLFSYEDKATSIFIPVTNLKRKRRLRTISHCKLRWDFAVNTNPVSIVRIKRLEEYTNFSSMRERHKTARLPELNAVFRYINTDHESASVLMFLGSSSS